MQFRTKLGLVDIPNEEVLSAARDIAGSERSPSEIAAPSGSLGVGGGSLPGLDAKWLADLWDAEADAHRMNSARTGNTHTSKSRFNARADQLESCAKELRRLAGLTISRQAEENAPVSHAPSAQPKSP